MAKDKKADTKRLIESYEHRDKQRVNNPPVGLVTPETDPEAGQKKRCYQYDPHIDPQLVWAGRYFYNSKALHTLRMSQADLLAVEKEAGELFTKRWGG